MAARRRRRGPGLASALARSLGRCHPASRHRRTGDAALRLVARGIGSHRDGELREAPMQITRTLSVIAIAAAALASTCAAAQEWPSRLVRIVVPAAAGGSSDAAARLVTNHFQTVFRQPFIIENKPGNGNALGAAFVAQAEHDGYTLLSSNSASNLTVPLIAKNAGYDPVADFSHIVMLTSSPYVLAVYPGLGVRTLDEFIAKARAAPL